MMSLGNEIATLVNEEKNLARTYEVEFNTNIHSVKSKSGSGVYLYRLQAENSVETKKMMLMK